MTLDEFEETFDVTQRDINVMIEELKEKGFL